MSRALLLALCLGASSCRSSPTSDPPAALTGDERAPPPATSAGADPRGPGDEGPDEAPDEAPDGGWAAIAGASSCELGCAEVYDCVLVVGEREAAEAAAVELGCLDACVSAGERGRARGALFGCALPATRAPERCAEFLSCVREAWPSTSPAPPQPTPVDEGGRGCERVCRALARCKGVDQSREDREAIALCSELCAQALDVEDERAAGACTELSTCAEIERCIMALPGA